MARLFFWRLAKAEAMVHGTTPLGVHLHEVGRKENVYRTLAVFDFLGRQKIQVEIDGPVEVGRGKVKTAHGWLQIPAPATRKLLEGLPTTRRGRGEKTTPTGACWIRMFSRA